MRAMLEWRAGVNMGILFADPPSQPPPQGGRCRIELATNSCGNHRPAPSPLRGGLGRGAGGPDAGGVA